MSRHAGRVLYVITDLEIGGVPLHLHRLVSAMRRRGFTPLVVSLAAPAPVGQLLRDDGIEVFDCGGRGGWDVRVLPRLTRLIRRLKPHLVHSILFHANVATRWSAHRAGLPPARVLCEIQTVEVEKGWHLTVNRWTHRGCRFTIGNSPSVIAHLVDRGRIPAGRLRLVRGGIDPNPLRDAAPIDRADLGLRHDDRFVLWVGRLQPIKGLETLIDAFHIATRHTHAHLVMAGCGPMRDRLVERCLRLGIAPRVHFVGPRDDVARLLRAADLFAFPSRAEGLPNALLEAMAAGCPVVTTDVPGCRDLIEHERTGVIVPYGDTPALACAIVGLLDDRRAALEYAGLAAEVVQHSWHIDKTLDGYAAVYDEVMLGCG